MYIKWLLTSLLLISVSAGAFAQSDPEFRTIQAHRLPESTTIRLDGKLNEAIWHQVPVSTDFTMQEPIEGGDPTEKTEVQIVYDEENIYLGVTLYDSDPSAIKAFQKRRDAGLNTDDRFRWIFDTFHDQRNAYFFEVNPNALRRDALISTGQGISFNRNWDGIWDAKVFIGQFGWSIEIVIPFQSLSFNPNSDRWGVNFQRTIRRKNEDVLWTGYRRNQGVFRPQNAGDLVGISQVSQGIGLEVVPFGILDNNKTVTDNSTDTETDADGGLDISYNIIPSLEASATFNTDFAETEVDQRRVNLTRFPLFFPEQRDFFLEGSNILSFAPGSGVNPFFSRRIGLVDGEDISITWGSRILGTVGSYNMALMQVRTGEQGMVNAEHFSVARVKKNVLKESTLGIIYTRRATENQANLDQPLQARQTAGADLEYGTSTFLNDKNLQLQAFFIYHNSAFAQGDTSGFWDRTSRGGRINFPNEPWSGHVSYREFGSQFDPAVGFTPRNAFKRVQPSISFSPLFEKSQRIQEFRWSLRFEHLTDLSFQKLTQDVNFTLFNMELVEGDEISIQINRNFERLQQPFDILRDGSIIIPVDDYVNWGFETELEFANFRRVTGQIEIEKSGFWTGNRTVYSTQITGRPLPGINLTAEYERTDVSLDGGSFNTDVVRFVGNFDFTSSFFVTTNIQFDNVSDILGMNNRLRWIIKPGSDLFLVYNHNWRQDDITDRFRTLERTGTVKLSITHRF